MAAWPGPPSPDNISWIRACSMIRESHNPDQPTVTLERATEQSLQLNKAA